MHMVRHPHPWGSCTVLPLLCLEMVTLHRKLLCFEAAIHMQENARKVLEFASQVVLGRMCLTLHATRRTPHGAASRLVHATSAGSVKTRRAPARHCRNARVYGHTTTAIRHEMSIIHYTMALISFIPPRHDLELLLDVSQRSVWPCYVPFPAQSFRCLWCAFSS